MLFRAFTDRMLGFSNVAVSPATSGKSNAYLERIDGRQVGEGMRQTFHMMIIMWRYIFFYVYRFSLSLPRIRSTTVDNSHLSSFP